MQDGDPTTRRELIEVREFNGRRIYTARRLRSGNWLLIETDGSTRRTINNEEFARGYERIARHDSDAGRGPGI
jgi:hypothetical protein